MQDGCHDNDAINVPSGASITSCKIRAKDPRKTPKKIDHRKTIELANRGLTPTEIAHYQGCDPSNITRVLQRYGLERTNIDEYISQRPQILAGLQDKILQSITMDDLKRSPVGQRVMMYGILYDKERLETGKSTQNVQGVYHLISEIERAERKNVGSSSDIDSQSGKHGDDNTIDVTPNDTTSQTVDSQGSTQGV
jgi:hypothetical protein